MNSENKKSVAVANDFFDLFLNLIFEINLKTWSS